ncbi:centromere protein R [Eucyclogobius newberryi]|uniref:centromere protein R n=1 Tax=Eucyclogobius newberryi TaxID=166745 RepID=UPI003B58F583
MDSLRSKLEHSSSAFIKARKELEEVLSAGGSSEQGRVDSEAAAELKRELQRHRDLTAKVKLHLKENGEPKKPCQGKVYCINKTLINHHIHFII